MSHFIAATILTLQLGNLTPTEFARIHPDAATGQIETIRDGDRSTVSTRIILPS